MVRKRAWTSTIAAVLLLTSSTGNATFLDRMINACPQLSTICTVPSGPTPSPVSTGPTPTPSPRPTVRPSPTVSRVCEGGLGTRSLEIGVKVTLCFDVPNPVQHPIVEVKTVNLGDSSCSDLYMHVITPNGSAYDSNGSQPGVAAFAQSGKWYVELTLASGCNSYRFSWD